MVDRCWILLEVGGGELNWTCVEVSGVCVSCLELWQEGYDCCCEVGVVSGGRFVCHGL